MTNNDQLHHYISIFPSEFDHTSIALQLREANVPVQLYADIRDRLWIPLREERGLKRKLLTAAANFEYELASALTELRKEIKDG